MNVKIVKEIKCPHPKQVTEDAKNFSFKTCSKCKYQYWCYSDQMEEPE